MMTFTAMSSCVHAMLKLNLHAELAQYFSAI